MDWEIRALQPEDARRYRELLNQAFSAGRVVPEAPELPPQRTGSDLAGSYGLFDGRDGLRAAYSLIDFRAHWGETALLPLGGVAGVATFADARGKGCVRELLRHSLKTMRERGQVLSALYPFASEFYRRHGWAWVGEKRNVTLTLGDLPRLPFGGELREIPAEGAAETLKPLYTSHARRYRGVFDAETHRWARLLAHSGDRITYVYLHETAGGPGGYLVWRYTEDGQTIRVREMVAESPDAGRAFVSVLHSLAPQCERAKLALPADDPLWVPLFHLDPEARVETLFMGRVVDLPAAVSALRPAEGTREGALTIRVHDHAAPWNEGTWRVAREGGRFTCEVSSAPPDLTLDIVAFSQALFGEPSLAQLRRAGCVEVASEPGFALLGEVLSGPSVWTLDDF